MTCLRTENLTPSLQEKISPFFHEILQNPTADIHSLYLIGSVLTEDYVEKVSDINSIIVPEKLDLAFLDFLAPLGHKYGQQGLAVPVIMDPAYIQSSVDVFPIEFFNFKLVHRTLYGEDLLAGLEFDKAELRCQCEREIRGKIVWLQKNYLSSKGDRKLLAESIVRHLGSYLPLFRGILYLLGQAPATGLKPVLDQVSKGTGIDTGVFAEVYAIKKNLTKPSSEEIVQLFDKFYLATAGLVEVVDGLQI